MLVERKDGEAEAKAELGHVGEECATPEEMGGAASASWKSGWYDGSYWRSNKQRYGKRGGKNAAYCTARCHAQNMGKG